MRNSKRNGFTLVEAVVVIAIIAVMMGIAFPAFSALIPGVRLRACGQEVYRNMQLAREEAIKRNRKVSVEFDSENCDQLKPWSGLGYRMYVGDDPARWNDADRRISQGVLPALVAVCREAGKTDNRKVTFRANGLPTSNDSFFMRNSKGRYLKANLASAGAVKITNEKP